MTDTYAPSSADAFSKTRPSGFRFQAVMTASEKADFTRLRDETESDSYGEVVRRALILFETYPDEPVDVSVFPTPLKRGGVPCTERLQLVLSVDTKERLLRLEGEFLKKGLKLSQMEIIRRALRVFDKAHNEFKMHTVDGQKLRSDNPAHRLALRLF